MSRGVWDLWRYVGDDTLKSITTRGPGATRQGAYMARRRHPDEIKETLCIRRPEPNDLDRPNPPGQKKPKSNNSPAKTGRF